MRIILRSSVVIREEDGDLISIPAGYPVDVADDIAEMLIDDGYAVADGGGGSFTYVVPEQTIALPSESDSFADIEINAELLEVDVPYLLYYSVEGLAVGGTGYIISDYETEDGEEWFNTGNAPIGEIFSVDGSWKVMPTSAVRGKNLTIKAIPCSQIDF